MRQYGKDCYLHEDQKHLIVPKKMGHFLLHRPIEGTPKTVHLVLRTLVGDAFPEKPQA